MYLLLRRIYPQVLPSTTSSKRPDPSTPNNVPTPALTCIFDLIHHVRPGVEFSSDGNKEEGTWGGTS